MNIGQKIKQLRFQRSLTQDQLAERLGISAQAVSKWENAVSMPDISILPTLSEVFGVSIDDLFDLADDQKMRRIENRMQTDDDIAPVLFQEYETFLKEQMDKDNSEHLVPFIPVFVEKVDLDNKRIDVIDMKGLF